MEKVLENIHRVNGAITLSRALGGLLHHRIVREGDDLVSTSSSSGLIMVIADI